MSDDERTERLALNHPDNVLGAITRAISADTLHLFPEEYQLTIQGALDNGWSSLLDLLKLAPKDMSGEAALTWWRNLSITDAKRGHVHSSHVCAARMFLAMPAGGAPSEATFSSTTETVTKKRNQLGDDTLEMMTVVRNFLRSPEFDLTKLTNEMGEDANAAVKAWEAAEVAGAAEIANDE